MRKSLLKWFLDFNVLKEKLNAFLTHLNSENKKIDVEYANEILGVLKQIDCLLIETRKSIDTFSINIYNLIGGEN